jgi:hypothetical protein
MSYITSMKLNLKSKVEKDLKQINVAVNGGFELPNQNGSFSMYDEIPGWKGDVRFEIGKGSLYIPAWGNTQVAELDCSANATIHQIVKSLQVCSCDLKFKWAGRTGDASSSLNVFFNGQKVFTGVPTDKSIHEETVLIVTHQGDNPLAFAGAGVSDGKGVTIDDVEIWCLEHSVPVPEPPTPTSVDDC